ncbi:MAG TPA: orotidine-5'-phosphate decarboxylase [Anaerolineales bacterium]|nr:orotidine-5'-phosphate decarboxylase [Anaerolineales bacterium]
MESFFSLLKRRADDAVTLLCVGLDPHPGDLPEPTAGAALDFCLRLVDETARYAAAFKPNAAFFEVHGAEGWTALKTLIDHIRESTSAAGSRVPVLLDAKRGDIASTAEAYAQAIYTGLGADAVTLNPYLGADSITPFLADQERGVFLLCKTSNPGAADLQDLEVGPGETLYERVARLAQGLNGKDNVGLVVGATQLEALRRVRAAAPDLWFLAPGVGSQGGDLEAALAAGLRADGMGMLVPVSRAIARSDDPRRAAAELRDRIIDTKYQLTTSGSPVNDTKYQTSIIDNRKPFLSGANDLDLDPGERIQGSDVLAALAGELIDLGCVKFGKFKLKSGLESPFYIDLRRLAADPKVLGLAAEALVEVLDGLEFDRVAALPYAAVPIGTAVCLRGGWPLVYPRKEVKDYGTGAAVEGVYEPGEVAVVLDDLISTGGSKFEGIEKLEAAGLVVRDVVVLIDRSGGRGEAELAARGAALRAVFTLEALLDFWEEEGRVEVVEIAAVRGYLGQK